MSFLGAGLQLKAASEQLGLGLVLNNEVQFAVAQGQPFLIPRQAIALTTCGAPGEARLRSLPGAL